MHRRWKEACREQLKARPTCNGRGEEVPERLAELQTDDVAEMGCQHEWDTGHADATLHLAEEVAPRDQLADAQAASRRGLLETDSPWREDGMEDELSRLA